LSNNIIHYIYYKIKEENYYIEKKKVNLSLEQAVEAHGVGRRRSSHIFKTVDSQMAVRLSAIRVGLLSFTPNNISGTLLEAESTPGP
jgi:hypothetical protein